MFTEHVVKKLSAYCNGELRDDESRRVAAHLLKCERCNKAYERIRLGVGFAEQLSAVSAPADMWSDIEALLDAQTRQPAVKPARRVALERGKLHAFITAPPRLFFVDTPSAEAIDLGCEYTLAVDDAGIGLLHVTLGWVMLERDGRESYVPIGAMCETRPGVGPGTPFFEDASLSFKEA